MSIIEVVRRAFDWLAWVSPDKGHCSRGSSIDEAVASLMESWPEQFEPSPRVVTIRLHLTTNREA